MAVSVTFNHVSKRFGDVRAVDDVALTIEPGELFFLLGPSGCGKTTLLRSLAGFLAPDTGTIELGEKDITRLPPHKRDTGMVFQSYALWPHLTVAENVAFGLQMRRLAKDDIASRVDEVLRLVRMETRAKQKPNQLSGGQQQRVALARALVIRPQCLLLDEPLSNLDAKLRLDMRGEIRRICKESGLTAIYVTHDQKEALSIADRLAVMRDGQIQQVGTPREIYLRPATTFVAGFIGETNFLSAEVLSIGEPTRLRTEIGDLVSTVALPDGVAAGDSVTLSLRPEVIRFDAPPDGAENVLNGTVHDSVYMGEVAQHAVNLPRVNGFEKGSVTLKAFDLNPRIVARDSATDASVWIDPCDLVPLVK